MTVITKEHIDHHCKTLSISREELTDFTIPDGVKKIGRWAFNNCASLKSITIPNGVINIEWNTFQGCTSLTSITIPDSIIEIGEGAFAQCSSLKSIIIPDSVKKIGREAFYECTSLESISIPDSVTEIQSWAFYGCLARIICNNLFLFSEYNTPNKDRIQFIYVTEYFKVHYKNLLKALNSEVNRSGFNTNHVSSKELNLIIKLHQEDFLPDWKTLATTFKKRSIDQIFSILKYFNKINCIPDIEDQFSFINNKNQRIGFPDRALSMFFTSKNLANLSMTARAITFNPQKQEQDSLPFCSNK